MHNQMFPIADGIIIILFVVVILVLIGGPLNYFKKNCHDSFISWL